MCTNWDESRKNPRQTIRACGASGGCAPEGLSEERGDRRPGALQAGVEVTALCWGFLSTPLPPSPPAVRLAPDVSSEPVVPGAGGQGVVRGGLGCHEIPSGSITEERPPPCPVAPAGPLRLQRGGPGASRGQIVLL